MNSGETLGKLWGNSGETLAIADKFKYLFGGILVCYIFVDKSMNFLKFSEGQRQ
ncbi:hypothetical protein J0895_12015 [Phormidium pseudopriestleyi FRX01]|uniref:Uncharacterized protein n=1 Tax=Phormidium pseudopriestleyi FRX01 TaxID=1759528 RepID=A0ABS3FSQ2_9CYAN|nr:hypothetical protein [Phormidium pseudopriestleyi]MBO0349823.1 hypothetical protein [Phormidium pseudopriestleyi FRX01]